MGLTMSLSAIKDHIQNDQLPFDKVETFDVLDMITCLQDLRRVTELTRTSAERADQYADQFEQSQNPTLRQVWADIAADRWRFVRTLDRFLDGIA